MAAHIGSVLIDVYMFYCSGHYQYMQPYHHWFNHTPMHHNWLFWQSVTLESTANELPADGVTALKYVGAILMYRVADKSLARPTSRCILFDGENISFDVSFVIYIYI